MLAVDLHTHTRFFHGFERIGKRVDTVGARLLVATARRRGLDGVALTNHDYYRAFGLGGTIPGIEISTTRGHVLVVGPDPPTRMTPGALTPGEAVERAHERDCAAIIAHPYRDSAVADADADFDAVEVNGKHPRTGARVRQLAAGRDLPVVGGSDAHYPFEVGRAFTLVDADELTPAAVVAAIRDGRVEPRIHRGTGHQLIRALYRRIHDGKGAVSRPADER